MNRPWSSLGISWILAVIVVVIVGLGLLGVIALGGNVVLVCILLLALAMLL